MDKTLKILDGLGDTHEHFQEYRKVIELIVTHREDNPDICIESCKALFEGIAHVILRKLDNNYSFEHYKEKQVQKLVKEMFDQLKNHVEIEEHSYIQNFAKEIGSIRNERGEISHGKPYPKDIVSEIVFSNMVTSITDTYIAYILQIYFSIQFEEVVVYQYENYEEFNNWLDEQDAAGFFKSYSKALYDTDYVRYEDELKNYYPEEDL